MHLLSEGDRIAILSPASIVKPEYIDGAAEFLRSQGFDPVIMPHAKGPASGTYAASDSDRLEDLLAAYRDSSIRAILCARGGYGCNHLIDKIPPSLLTENPKWLIGFSDISALHSAVLTAPGRISSLPSDPCPMPVTLHSPMAKHLALLPPDHYCTVALIRILTEGLPMKYEVPSHPLATPGHAEGTLVGGNLAVINGLADTPYDPLRIPGPKILFIEDIAEQIYAVERMLIRMKLSGRLSEVTGIVCGHFTEYLPDHNYPDMESMIHHLLSDTRCPMPVALSFPAGHTDDNLPLPLGARASLTVTPQITTLSFDNPM